MRLPFRRPLITANQVSNASVDALPTGTAVYHVMRQSSLRVILAPQIKSCLAVDQLQTGVGN